MSSSSATSWPSARSCSETFEAHKQTLLDERQRKAQNCSTPPGESSTACNDAPRASPRRRN
ncbi:hypothetical protein ACPA9J_16460 [Pseudomonas aeruginosa]